MNGPGDRRKNGTETMRKDSFATAALLTIALAVAAPMPVQAGGLSIPAEPRGLGYVPECDSPSVIGTIISRRAGAVPEATDGVTIDEVTQIGPGTLYMPGMRTIGHRHCAAKALLSNGKTGALFYMIEGHMGFSSISWNVESCVAGYDPWYVFGQSCRTLR